MRPTFIPLPTVGRHMETSDGPIRNAEAVFVSPASSSVRGSRGMQLSSSPAPAPSARRVSPPNRCQDRRGQRGPRTSRKLLAAAGILALAVLASSFAGVGGTVRGDPPSGPSAISSRSLSTPAGTASELRALAATACPGAYTPQNVTIVNGTTNRVTASIPVGTEPSALVTDTATGDLFVTNWGSSNVSVLNGSTNDLVATIPVGSSPRGIAYDRANGDLYVANYLVAPAAVTVLSGSNLTRIATISIPLSNLPSTFAVDTATDTIYVGNGNSNYVNVINGTTNQLAGNIAVPSDPYAMAIDPATGELYALDEQSANVSVINTTSNVVVANISVGMYPVALAFGPMDQDAYIVDAGIASGNVSVIDVANDSVVATIPAGLSPNGIAFDASNREVYVSNQSARAPYGGNVAIVNTTTNTVVANVSVGAEDHSPVADAANGDVYVADFGPGDVDVINGSTNRLLPPVASWNGSDGASDVLVDSSNGNIYVLNQAFWSGVTTYELSFSETGLPAGTNWTVGLTASWGSTGFPTYESSTLGCIWFEGYNATYAFTARLTSPAVNWTYVASPASGSFNVSGGPVNESIVFTFEPIYPVEFNETGLPNGSAWSLTFEGYPESSSTDTIAVWEPNGSYWYNGVEGPSEYAAAPNSGRLLVNGSARNIPIAFSTKTFDVNFTEFGLPVGTTWSVDLGGDTQSSASRGIPFEEPSGNYSYTVGAVPGYIATPTAGTVTVVGWNQSILLKFGPILYPANFTVSGLPSGTSWTVDLNGTELSSTGTVISFQEPAGIYPYSIPQLAGYYSALQGTVTVGAPGVTQSVVFAPIVFSLTFREAGLPNGTGWGVAIGSSIETTLGATVTFPDETNGTYGYVVLSISGYTTTYSGIAVVNGTDRTVEVLFVPQTFPVVIVEFGLANGTNWSVTITNASAGFNETHWSTTEAIVFDLPNGTYAVSVALPTGYTFALTATQLTVAGRATSGPTLNAQSTAPPSSRGVPPEGSGTRPAGSPDLPVELLGLALAIAAVLVGAWVLRRRPPRPARPPLSFPDAPPKVVPEKLSFRR
jgi:YVTN family beta-propeller protein